MDLAGIYRCLLWARPASAIANIAYRTHVRPSARIEDRLARFAGARPDTARRHDGHVAGVEIRAKGWNDRRATVVRRSGRVDKEGAIFLNDPAVVVAEIGSFVYAVQNRNRKTTPRREVYRHGRARSADGPLRVLRLVTKIVSGWDGVRRRKRRDEPAIWYASGGNYSDDTTMSSNT